MARLYNPGNRGQEKRKANEDLRSQVSLMQLISNHTRLSISRHSPMPEFPQLSYGSLKFLFCVPQREFVEIKCDNESKIALKRARHTDTYLHIAEAPGPSTWRFLVGSFLHEGKNELVIWQQVLLLPVNTLVQDRLVHWVKVKAD